ncbi:MAG: NUDIX hydrolase [Candidatus Nomurabacteria bacterium]|nr:NUDIX hydrolase [Candidatus Nomurabacteria bacterium]
MQKLIYTGKNLDWIKYENIMETYISDTIPENLTPTSVYAFVFKDGKFLMTDLKKGERPTRILDISGGHIDQGESPEEACTREAFEETGVRVKIKRLAGYSNLTITCPKPENYNYPYPTSCMLFYLCEIINEEDFNGNEDTHGRVWLAPEDFNKSEWCIKNKIFLEEVIKLI